MQDQTLETTNNDEHNIINLNPTDDTHWDLVIKKKNLDLLHC